MRTGFARVGDTPPRPQRLRLKRIRASRHIGLLSGLPARRARRRAVRELTAVLNRRRFCFVRRSPYSTPQVRACREASVRAHVLRTRAGPAKSGRPVGCGIAGRSAAAQAPIPKRKRAVPAPYGKKPEQTGRRAARTQAGSRPFAAANGRLRSDASKRLYRKCETLGERCPTHPAAEAVKLTRRGKAPSPTRQGQKRKKGACAPQNSAAAQAPFFISVARFGRGSTNENPASAGRCTLRVFALPTSARQGDKSSLRREACVPEHGRHAPIRKCRFLT